MEDMDQTTAQRLPTGSKISTNPGTLLGEMGKAKAIPSLRKIVDRNQPYSPAPK